MKRCCSLILILVGVSVLAGCAIDRLPFVYKPDQYQGMILTQDMVDQLKAGMTRRQVEFVLGPPAITDTFHPNRWEYIDGSKPGGEDFQSKRISVFFEDDRLMAVRGDLEPADPALRR